MKRLNIPLANIKAKDIYIQCANDFMDENIKNTALKFGEVSVLSSKEYMIYVPKNISALLEVSISDTEKKDFFSDTERKVYMTEIEKKDILKLYKNKFAKQGEIGRKYYDAIWGNGGSVCPMCGVGKRKNLDHFLPQSIYPLLCVTPINLVPICRDCNTDKSTYFNKDYYKIPFNPYFEDLPDDWLKCSFVHGEVGEFTPIFEVGLDKNANRNLYEKCEVHLKKLKMDETFQNRAEEELGNIEMEIWDVLREGDKNTVKEDLFSKYESRKKNDKSSWATAFYKGLYDECDDFCNWLSARNSEKYIEVK